MLQDNPKWEADGFRRFHNLEDINAHIKKILFVPNVLKTATGPRTMPYDECRAFWLYLTDNGILRYLSTGPTTRDFSKRLAYEDEGCQSEIDEQMEEEIKGSPSTTIEVGIVSDPEKMGQWRRWGPQPQMLFQTRLSYQQDENLIENTVASTIFYDSSTLSHATWEKKTVPEAPKVSIDRSNEVVVCPVFPEEGDADELVLMDYAVSEEDEKILLEDEQTDLYSTAEPHDLVHAISGEEAAGVSSNAGIPQDRAESPTVSILRQQIEDLKEEMKTLKERTDSTVVPILTTEDTSSTSTSDTTTTKNDIPAITIKQKDRSPPKLPVFEPSTMSIRTYVDAVIQILSAYPDLTRDVALSQVILALREPYLSNLLLVNDLDAQKTKTIKDLLLELKEVTSIENESLSSSLFSKRSQAPNEDANAYGNALLTMARDAFGKTDERAIETPRTGAFYLWLARTSGIPC